VLDGCRRGWWPGCRWSAAAGERGGIGKWLAAVSYALRMPTPAVGGERLPVVVARSVSKSFTVPEEQIHTLKERALHPRRRVRHQTFEALRDISFAVAPGEFFGIAGRNGSGKSTLLKCLAGIYQAEGDIWCRGRLSTLIELGVGFNMDMAARDNVVMNGIMLGLSPREARRRYDSVIEFAELQEFKDLKLKNYSSGMQVRLAFSVAIQVDADILMIDEVLAVGDAAFQQKCFDVFNDLRDKGRTIIFVTHDMGALQRFCHRALLLERGSPVYIGEPHEVADRYLELNFGRDPQAEVADDDDGHTGDGDARVIEVWMEDARGERLQALLQHQKVTVNARVRFMVGVLDPIMSLTVLNDEHKPVVVATTQRENERTGQFGGGEDVVFSFTFDNVLAPGRYAPVFTVAHRGSGLDVIDRFDGRFSFVVTGPGALGGLVDLPVQSAVSRAGYRVPQ
jgi:ABC-type polysaccharide/polyol phosphate transport system ATPase subunit